MFARLSVGSRYTEWPLILLGVGAAACAALLAYGTANGKMPPAFAEVTGGVIALFLLRGWLVARGRRWITPTDEGFVLEDRRGARAFADADVSDLATESTVRYGNGVPKAVVRGGAIALPDGRVPFRYDYPLDRPDPLGEFLDRVLLRLTDQASAVVAAGGALEGDGWELTRDGLVVRSGGREKGLATEDVAAADVLDGRVCVWGRGEERPFARVPVGSANARVLLALLEGVVKANGAGRDDSVGGLGRVLFERGRSENPLALLLLTLLFVGAGTAVGGWAGGVRGAVFGTLGVCAVGSPVFLVMLLTAGNVFRCHTGGVYRRSCWRSRELRFEDVGAFTYAATRTYINGGYAGTTVWMRFSPRRGAGGRPVTFSASVTNADAELESLREHVSRVVGARLLQRLEGGESVAWADGLRLRPDGLEWTASGGLFGRAVTRLVPYDEIAGTDIQEGQFYLFLRGVRKAVHTAPVSAANFFPGLLVLETLRQQAPARRAVEFRRGGRSDG